jgi:hypothetical protein
MSETSDAATAHAIRNPLLEKLRRCSSQTTFADLSPALRLFEVGAYLLNLAEFHFRLHPGNNQ